QLPPPILTEPTHPIDTSRSKPLPQQDSTSEPQKDSSTIRHNPTQDLANKGVLGGAATTNINRAKAEQERNQLPERPQMKPNELKAAPSPRQAAPRRQGPPGR
ncbi:MAG: hypothetical protein JST36_11675, partial [Bacteroidetes bacterium]|nr:hypothetical protein [Bacteroidota bacterium]